MVRFLNRRRSELSSARWCCCPRSPSPHGRRERGVGTSPQSGSSASLASPPRHGLRAASKWATSAPSLLFYRLFWWPVGVLQVTTLCWGGAVAVGAAVRRRSDRHSSLAQLPWVLASLAAAAAAVVLSGVRDTDPVLWSLVEGPAFQAEAVHDLPARPHSVAVSFSATDAPAGWTANALTFVGQLRLRGLGVRFTDEALKGAVAPPLRAYRADHPVDGTEDVQVLFVAGPGAAAPPPAGYEPLSLFSSTAGDAGAPISGGPDAVFVRVG